MIQRDLKGLTVQELFGKERRGNAIAFEHILLPNQFLAFSKSDIRLNTFLTPEIPLAIPLVTSPMDTVTGARMGRAIADAGGIGIIHVNLQPSQQAREVGKVKHGGLIVEPLVLSPRARLEELECIREKYSHIPITEDGRPNGKLVGMISKKFRPLPHHEVVGECMELPVSAPYGDIIDTNGVVRASHALALMETHQVTALAVINDSMCLLGLLVASDLYGISTHTRTATLDTRGRRRVGAAIVTDDKDYERRVPRLIEQGVDVLCIDTAHGDSIFVHNTIQWVRERFPHIEIIAGNVSTAEGARYLIDSGAHALRVGNGSGDMCSTQQVTGAGSVQPPAIYRTAAVARTHHTHIPVIADGGIRNSGDIVKALALGADTVMVGTLVAALPESAAPLKRVVINGKPTECKIHRGMASEGALRERVVARYGGEEDFIDRMPEGEERPLEPSAVPLAEFMRKLMAGVRQGFNYLGVRSIEELHEKVWSGAITFDVVSHA